MNTPQTKNGTNRLIQELSQELRQLRWDNLQMSFKTLQEEISTIPTSRAAGLILAKYRRKRDKLNESFIALNN